MPSPETLRKLTEQGVITVREDGAVVMTDSAWRLCTGTPRAVWHFVGFKDDRYWSAVKTFGKPDFIHRFWDRRAVDEVAPGDVVIFAEGDERQAVREFAFDDSANFLTIC